MTVITISRQAGSGGDEIAAQVASHLKFHIVKRNYLEKAVYEYCLVKTIRQLPLPEIIPPAITTADSRLVHRHVLEAVLLNLAAKENLVLVGYGGQAIFRAFKSAFHVRIVAPFKNRVRMMISTKNTTRAQAAEHIKKRDLEKRTFLKDFFGVEIGRQHNYDLILNTGKLSISKAAEIISASFLAAIGQASESKEEFINYIKKHSIEKIDLVPDLYKYKDLPSKTSFAHPSEEEFASVLDFYRIKWEYEPREFPIRWDKQGVVIESFKPDFYLPEFDTYIELTTMKQDLVTRKNRKVKLVRELYPDINLKIFYGRDYQHLLSKYGMD